MKIAIVGKQGSGKTTLANKLALRGYKKVITSTTRPPREGETDGVDYHFLSEEEFKSLMDGERFLETSKQGDYWYGSKYEDYQWDPSLGEEKLVTVLDPIGVKKLSTSGINLFVVYLNPPSWDRINHLIRRGDDFDTVTIREKLEDPVFKVFEESFGYDLSIDGVVYLDDAVKIILDNLYK